MRRSKLSILSAVGLVLAGLLAGCMEKSVVAPFNGALLPTDVTGSLAGSPRSFSLDMIDSHDRPLVAEALARIQHDFMAALLAVKPDAQVGASAH